jgi:hypothetical protein
MDLITSRPHYFGMICCETLTSQKGYHMSHLHGQRLTPHYHEMTSFERRLAHLDKLAIKYHQKKAKLAVCLNETPEQRLARTAEMKADYHHLQQELRFAETIGEVEVRLQEYRLGGRSSDGEGRAESRAKRQIMERESHHSTEVLEGFLRVVGRPKPSAKHTAHHIVPGIGKTIFATRARARLHFHCVRINDPDNGVWMVRYKRDKEHWSMSKANSHLEIHTKNYEGWVYRIVNAAFNETELRAGLRRIGKLLEKGRQPKEITMPPDESWVGV